MKKGTFEGTSKNGSIEEAITNAINIAKQNLEAELVTWKLATISGENGGFVPTNLITVELKVKATKDKKVEVKKTKIKAEKPKKVEVKTVKAVKDKAVKTKAKN